ncbi:MAG TPA: hypothetical protein VN616_06355 [Puia sp.]|nr:hypothetical protein [Puia sp.]
MYLRPVLVLLVLSIGLGATAQSPLKATQRAPANASVPANIPGRANASGRAIRMLPRGPQPNALVNTGASAHALLTPVDMGDVRWTGGFWARRFAVCRTP